MKSQSQLFEFQTKHLLIVTFSGPPAIGFLYAKLVLFANYVL